MNDENNFLQDFRLTPEEYCERCDSFYTPFWTNCNCHIVEPKLIDGMKPLDWAMSKVEDKK